MVLRGTDPESYITEYTLVEAWARRSAHAPTYQYFKTFFQAPASLSRSRRYLPDVEQ